MPGESQKEPTTGTPDPTVLTTEALQREVKVIRDEMDMRIAALRDVFNEQMRSVATELKLIERQRKEQKQDTKAAVVDALNAAKEAVKEQTSASDKAITNWQNTTSDALKTQATVSAAAIAEVNTNQRRTDERVGKIENIKLGANEQRVGIYAFVGFLAAVLVIGGVVAAVLAARP